MVGPDMQDYLGEGPILGRGRRVVWLRTHLFCLGRKWSRLSEANHVGNGLPKPAKTAKLKHVGGVPDPGRLVFHGIDHTVL